MDVRGIARVVHEANRAVQMVQADSSIPVSRPWDDTDGETRSSAIDGVQAVLDGADSKQSHENWVSFKRAHGWIYGPVKDEANKTHPLLIPYEDLPEAQRVKDDLFGAIVRALS